MDSKEIRQKFLDFYKERSHTIIPSASLIPEKDSSLLFVNSGMFPLVPYLLGEDHPEGKRLADSQKCFRSDDIEEVGDLRHTTFFEMLGNWSLGDYFKEEQLNWVFQLFTEYLELDPERIYVSVYRGNKEIGIDKDDESVAIWKEIFKRKGIQAEAVDFAEKDGMQGGRIFYYPDKENWWSRAGAPENMPVGEPGGPDSEIFYDLGEEHKHHENSPFKNEPCHINCDCGRFIEIGNSVFIQFLKKEEGFEKLPKQNVDFGGGLERLTMISQGKTSIFESDLFLPIIEKIEELSGLKYRENIKSFEVVADHIKAATFIIGDERGISPSNKEQGYFVRRLIRRAIRHGRQLGISKNNWLKEVAEKVVSIYEEVYPEIKENSSFVYQELSKEEETFKKTLERGIKEFEKMKDKKVIDGESASFLYQTYGFPIEIIEEMATESGQEVDKEGFYEETKKHQELSRKLSAGAFKGGLGDHEEETVKLHTATHLLLSALRKVIGDTVFQKGSNITSKRLRFDFSCDRKLTDEELKKVEEIINEAVEKDMIVKKEEMDLNDALKICETASFKEKYPSKVFVYSVVDSEGNIFSREICTGPHISKTSELGKFSIKKQEASSAGVRRIKATLN
ncbi:MAG: alanine--tRNA ligase [Candidatus Pacebacteria bacterium]|nr:alanine--tRNA ligase [Candidatus Paceibacterota bacterium]